ncbi:MAG: hypothetical protein IMF12_07970 [Proteobacteria bacterium]|nr:hypothetical protein [Pseudomonadota bacterium]
MLKSLRSGVTPWLITHLLQDALCIDISLDEIAQLRNLYDTLHLDYVVPQLTSD